MELILILDESTWVREIRARGGESQFSFDVPKLLRLHCPS